VLIKNKFICRISVIVCFLKSRDILRAELAMKIGIFGLIFDLGLINVALAIDLRSPEHHLIATSVTEISSVISLMLL
jgi:hypothetical protein